MNVLITAGGTTEKIDNVRSISNFSTGKLGSLIAKQFSIYPTIENVFYICSKAAIKPKSEKVTMVHADNVASLEKAIKDILNHTSIDIIVHSMAVSDYRVKAVTSVTTLADSIISNITKKNISNEQDINNAILSSFEKSKSAISEGGKISSNVDDMLLLMERTPKIIKLYQTLSPQSTLVGFKLLDNVPLETLIDKGFQILIQNQCSFVMANDFSDIKGERHIGYLIDKKKEYTRYVNKKEIARAIVSASINERRKSG